MEVLFTQDNMMLLARLLALCVAIPLHELAHAVVSDKLGDHTARDAGRITLNPIKHIDPLGLLSMLFIGVGWAKPVPVNPRYYKNHKKGMAITSLAGPISNMMLAVFAMVAFKLVYYIGFSVFDSIPLGVDVAGTVLYYFAVINVSLALFNMLPIPPLDGSRVLGVILPDKIYFSIMKVERYIMIVLILSMVILPRLTGFSPIGWLLGPLTYTVVDFLDTITIFIDRLFGL